MILLPKHLATMCGIDPPTALLNVCLDGNGIHRFKTSEYSVRVGWCISQLWGTEITDESVKEFPVDNFPEIDNSISFTDELF